MKKTGLIFLASTFLQLIITIISYEFYYIFKMSIGGIGGTVLSHVHPIISMVLCIEFVISIALIYGKEIKSYSNFDTISDE